MSGRRKRKQQPQHDIECPSEVPLTSNMDHWKRVFAKYDKDTDGYINLKELRDLIESREYEHDIPDHVVKKIHQMVDRDEDGRIDLNEFIAMLKNPELQPIFGHLVSRYVCLLIPNRHGSDNTTEVDGQYEEQYTCCPPPVAMILISLVEIVLYCVDAATDSASSATGPIATVMIYDPYKRNEAWRFVTYMFVHIGIFHLVVNLFVQILLGIPLEMVHRGWRVLIIYFAGVLAGSLATSIVDPQVKLAGASGGVYSLITAHIATIIMNWKDMEYPAIQLFIFLVITGCDVGTSIYNRYVLDINENIGYAAHFAGGLAGLLVGINVLRNIQVSRTERVIWWISIITYIMLMTIAIIWHVAVPNYFPKLGQRY